MKSWIIAFLILVSIVGIANAGKLSSYPFKTTLATSDYFPAVVSSANANVNWQSLQELNSENINWAYVNGIAKINNGGMNWADINNIAKINNSGVNWTNLQDIAQNLNGMNWYLMSTQGAGINWYRVANGASTTFIMCWKANGQPGKCSGGVTGAFCNSCN